MSTQSLQRLQWLSENIPSLAAAISEAEWSHKPAPEKWSKKEILGHLIDSATNNHQRFVRIQFEDTPAIRYDQNQWNSCSRYQLMAGRDLLHFWSVYNKHLAELVKHIPAEDMQRTCFTGDPEPHALQWLFDDYVIHMEHHLKQILQY